MACKTSHEPSRALTNLSIVSYNMHGFNQGASFLRSTCDGTSPPDIIYIQENWLTPSNLYKINNFSQNFTAFGISAMANAIDNGILRGRPWGGVSILLNNMLCKDVVFSLCEDRFVCIVLYNTCFLNVYLPSDPNSCIDSLIDSLSQLDAACVDIHNRFNIVNFIFGGDMNVNVTISSRAASLVNEFAARWSIHVCNSLITPNLDYTYSNTALGHYSLIDFFFVSHSSWLRSHKIIDSPINLSDHLAIEIVIKIAHVLNTKDGRVNSSPMLPSSVNNFRSLDWAAGNKISFYNYTYECALLIQNDVLKMQNTIQSLHLKENNSLVHEFNSQLIDKIYKNIVDCLIDGSTFCIPVKKYNLHSKHWWNRELDALKAQSIKTHAAWVAADKPRSGNLFDEKNKSKIIYKNKITSTRKAEGNVLSSSLQDTLLNQSQQKFWKVWKSKFDNKNKLAACIGGESDPLAIANLFAVSFSASGSSSSSTSNLAEKSAALQDRLSSYTGSRCNYTSTISRSVLTKLVTNLPLNKSAGFDNLTAEHLKYCHPLVLDILLNLFSLMVSNSYVPGAFGCGITVPLPKATSKRTHSSLDDYRGITILPIISKLFEFTLLKCLTPFLCTSNSQFGFKKGHSCAHAIFSARKITEYFTSQNSTVNLCSLDISKAFDRLSHYHLFNKLMDRNIPLSFIALLYNWYSKMETVVRWGAVFSHSVRLLAGVRQGSVLAPSLFSVFVDSLLLKLSACKLGCHIKGFCFNSIMYADDLLLLSLSISDLQKMINLCQSELSSLELTLNNSKSVCLRIGPRHATPIASVAIGVNQIGFKQEMRYLGCTLLAGPSFACSLQRSKQSFFRASNSIFGKIGTKPEAHQLTLKMIDFFCLPSLLYAFEAIGNRKQYVKSLNFIYNSIFVKLFHIKDVSNIHYCQFYTGCLPASYRLDLRLLNFCEAIKFDKSDSYSSKLFQLVGDQYYYSTLNKYNMSELTTLSRRYKLQKVWEHFESSL